MTPQELATAVADVVQDHVALLMAPVLERLAVAEARLASQGDVRDRLISIETKAALPVAPVDLSGILERLHDMDSRHEVAIIFAKNDLTKMIAAISERIVALETKAAQSMPPPPVIDPVVPVDLSPVLERVASVEVRLSTLSDLTKDIGTLRERVAVVEVRQPIPGPPGVNGKDGADGMGWDDLAVEHDGERSFAVKLTRGDRVKDAGTFVIPAQIYRGIYTDGRTYEPGDTVTYARSLWHCLKTTILKPDAVSRNAVTGEAGGPQGKDFWKMVVKGAQDGKDGRDGRDAGLPVVSVGRS